MNRSDCSVPNDDVRKRARAVVRGLKKSYPDADCALNHESPYQLLAATILSAQCTDERVNMVTPRLFERYPLAEDLARGRIRDIERIVKSTGFFRAKAKSLKGMAQGLVRDHDGEFPTDVESLVKLPGVGRKTANVVLGVCFGIASGVVVDTHVKRISNLLGLTSESTPEKIELDLMELLPRKEWIAYSHRVIHHGRQICIARRPRCQECPLLGTCQRVGLPELT